MGNGYTDHCPKCLWGKHVDEETPGDRASTCHGLLRPAKAEFKISNSKFKIKYKCVRCHHEFVVWNAEDDDREKLLNLII